MTETINFNLGGIIIIMKKTVISLACCALIAPLASAQTQKRETTPNEEGVTVTGTETTVEEGAAANYQPTKTLVVLEDRSNTPGHYVLNGPNHVVDKHGDVITTAIKPGTRVRVFYLDTGNARVVDHVVVD
jgi:hypothetical protein